MKRGSLLYTLLCVIPLGISRGLNLSFIDTPSLMAAGWSRVSLAQLGALQGLLLFGLGVLVAEMMLKANKPNPPEMNTTRKSAVETDESKPIANSKDSWLVALKYWPELETRYTKLARFDVEIADWFKSAVLEEQAVSASDQIFDQALVRLSSKFSSNTLFRKAAEMMVERNMYREFSDLAAMRRSGSLSEDSMEGVSKALQVNKRKEAFVTQFKEELSNRLKSDQEKFNRMLKEENLEAAAAFWMQLKIAAFVIILAALFVLLNR